MVNRTAIHTSIKRILVLLVLVCLLALASKTYSQTVGYYRGSDCTFNTSADISAGATSSNYFTVQYGSFVYNTTYAAGWTLRVRANGNFSNGSSSIPAQYVSLAFNSINGGPSGVSGTGFKTLSTSADAALITTSAAIETPPTYYFEHRFDLKIQGGSHLMIGTGTFSTTLTMTLVDKNGNTIASKNDVQASFVVNYSNNCNTATIGSFVNNQYTFTNYTQQMQGATVTDAVTIQYNPNSATCTGWSLKVRAAGNFTNGANSVAPQYFSFRFNRVSAGSPSASAIGVNNNYVTLSNTDVTLINQSNAGFIANAATEHKFDMNIQGGNHLLLPNGTYTGSLIFTLYNQSNQVVSTTTVAQSFAINSTTNSFTAVFQNSADNINMIFSTPADYASGISVTKTNGLKITGYNPYQVLVKTSSANLTKTSGISTIPVSVVNLQATKSTSTSAGINTYTRPLSASDQILITNPLSDYTQQVVEYTLRYYTQPGDSRIAGSGTFNTSVMFVVIPQ